MSSAQSEATKKSGLKRTLGYLFALACLVWVFHDVHPRRLIAAIHIENWWFVAACVAFDIMTYVLQGLRWKLLLRPVGQIRSLKATQAIYVGLFTNEVVPLRFGEVVRAYLASRWLKSRMTSVVPSMVVERFLDALWLVAAIGVIAIFIPLPRSLVHAGDVLGAIVLLATAAFLRLVLRKEKELEHGVERSNGRAGSALSRFVANAANGLREIGLSRNLYIAAALSAAMLACQGLAFWFIMLACGLNLGALAACVVLVVVRLGTAIPNAPANVGSFQFATVVALGLFGVDKTIAAAFSVVDFTVLTAPLWIIGLISLAATGMSFAGIRSEIAAVRRSQPREESLG